MNRQTALWNYAMTLPQETELESPKRFLQVAKPGLGHWIYHWVKRAF